MATTPPNTNTITPPTSVLPPPQAPTKNNLTFQTIDGQMITEVHLAQCAELFSTHYGIWGQQAAPPLKAGNRVKMTSRKLRQQCLGHPYETILAMAWEDNSFIGHAFATKWKYGDGYVGWITQLVVDSHCRRQGIASMLLRRLAKTDWSEGVNFMGLVSSHPGACNALCNVYYIRPEDIDTTIISTHAAAVVACTNVDYLKNLQFRGSLFEQNPPPETVSQVFTSFWVDHSEPLLALGICKQRREWVLGDLLDGHEYFVLIPVVERPVTRVSPDPFL